jgi:3-hydroxypropanoate dehydrogenase
VHVPTDLTDPTDLHKLYSLSPEGQALLFTEARTARKFTDEPVGEDQLRAIWNCSNGRRPPAT